MDHTPDLVFLDVQMPQMNGFEVIEAVGGEKMPLVIFVTAYDQHALRAFQVRALDFPLKGSTPSSSPRRCSARASRSSGVVVRSGTRLNPPEKLLRQDFLKAGA